jgi:hypothetical protein
LWGCGGLKGLGSFTNSGLGRLDSILLHYLEREMLQMSCWKKWGVAIFECLKSTRQPKEIQSKTEGHSLARDGMLQLGEKWGSVGDSLCARASGLFKEWLNEKCLLQPFYFGNMITSLI